VREPAGPHSSTTRWAWKAGERAASSTQPADLADRAFRNGQHRPDEYDPSGGGWRGLSPRPPVASQLRILMPRCVKSAAATREVRRSAASRALSHHHRRRRVPGVAETGCRRRRDGGALPFPVELLRFLDQAATGLGQRSSAHAPGPVQGSGEARSAVSAPADAATRNGAQLPPAGKAQPRDGAPTLPDGYASHPSCRPGYVKRTLMAVSANPGRTVGHR
jgi:hypothetical protein